VIAEGDPAKIAKDPAVLEAYLGRHGTRRSHPAEAAAVAIERPPLLALKDIDAGYDASSILRSVDLEVRVGEVVALLGRNGAGKTTTLRTMMGVLKPTRGTITFAGQEITSLSPDRVNRSGIAIVPEGRRIFPNLTVVENLMLGQRDGGWPLDEIYQLFPKLRMRQDARGENLSGGERQMLAIGRALLLQPRLLIVDELSLGLAPRVVEELMSQLQLINARHGVTVLMAEQSSVATSIAQRAFVIETGVTRWSGQPGDVGTAGELIASYLGTDLAGD
jgi:ABC-type branched-subunit amino acid transport system ATPase component